MVSTGNPRFRNTAAALALAGALAGCTELRWHRDGANAVTHDRDLNECQAHAIAEARRELPMVFSPEVPRTVGVTRTGLPVMDTSNRYANERTMLEGDLTRRCMQDKGYALVPVEKR